MSFIKTAPKVLEPRRARRWVTVLDADELAEEPKVEFDVGILVDKKLMGISKPYRKRNGEVDLGPDDVGKFRKDVLYDIMKAGEGWRGMTKGNARRMCEILMHHPELLEDVPEGQELPFDLEDLGFIAEHMSSITFGRILDAALDMEAYATEELMKSKKSSATSSDSPSQD